MRGAGYYRYEPVEIDALKCQHYADLADRDASLRNIDLFSTAGRERLAKMIEADAGSHGDPVLIALDTGTSLIAAMHRKDSTQAWADLTLALRWLSNRLRCCVCILLHAQKSGAAPRGPVGHLLADCDAELKAIARENNQCEVQVLKQRGGSAGFSYIFDVVPVALPSGSQPVIVLRGRADEEVRRPTTPREAATAERDSAWLMRLARALEDGERSPPSGVLMRAWGGDGGNQLARMRRLVPFDEGVTIHIPDDGVMKTIMLVIEDSQELLCCTARPAVVGGTPRTASSEETPEDVVPEEHADGDDLPVPRGHMTPREARWFLHFQRAFSASPADERRYAMLIGNPRLPVFTQDREAGIRCLHDVVANSDNPAVRERARIALGMLGIKVPPPPEPEPVVPTKPTVRDIMDQPLPEGQDRIGAFFGAIEQRKTLDSDLPAINEQVIEWIRQQIATDPVRTGELFRRNTLRDILDHAERMMQEAPPKKRGGWPKGKPRGPRKPKAP